MALLEDCFFCSLSVAASVIGVYTMVAYVIAFFMETWWIVNTPVSLPSPAYVLCASYLIVSVFSGILLRGLSIKNSLFLLEWLLVVAALSVPEGVLVYFMSIHYWNIRSLYGLMELTCWVCRAIVNVTGMICVQSLYSNWREEKEVLRTLRELKMTRVMPNRRNSVGPGAQTNGYANGAPGPGPGPPALYTAAPPPQVLNNGAFVPVPTLRRSASMVSVMSRAPNPAVVFAPAPYPYMAANPNEFNASQFNLSLMNSFGPMGQQGGQQIGPQMGQMSKSYSMVDLRSSSSLSDVPRKTMSVVDFPIEKKPKIHTQSLDRRTLKLPPSGRPIHPQTEGFYVGGRLKNGYFTPYRNDFYIDPTLELLQNGELIYGRNINSFYPAKVHSRSKHSLGSDSDDFKKYRDIAL